MSYNVSKLPPAYKLELDNDTSMRVSYEENNRSSYRSSIRYDHTNYGQIFFWCIAGCGAAGLLFGFMPCINYFNSSYSLGSALLTWLTWIGGGLGIGLVLAIIIASCTKGSIAGNNSAMQKKMTESEQNVVDIRNNADSIYASYCADFEQAAQQESVRYATSELATQLIEWMSNGFYRTIDAADRRPHVAQIIVPFEFRVYSSHIRCNLGDFDFEIHRCSNLPTGLDQAALARAIGSAIRVNVTMRYPQDASGTSVIVQYQQSYTNDSVCIVLTYSAPNGYYQTAKRWV